MRLADVEGVVGRIRISTIAMKTCSKIAGSSSYKKVMLSGKVYDPNGAVVMGSDVLARSRDGQDYHGRTNSKDKRRPDVFRGIAD